MSFLASFMRFHVAVAKHPAGIRRLAIVAHGEEGRERAPFLVFRLSFSGQLMGNRVYLSVDSSLLDLEEFRLGQRGWLL